MFCQLSRRGSFRDLIVAIEARRGKAKFFRIRDSVTHSNLAKANQNMECHNFEEFAYYMVEQARTLRVPKIFTLLVTSLVCITFLQMTETASED